MNNEKLESFQRIEDNLRELAKLIIQYWSNYIQERLEESIIVIDKLKNHIEDARKEIEIQKALRALWIVVRDTRLHSQVIDNKPRHLVRKIIR